ncbi:ABC transporter ATP-binding protein [Natronorubrum aibiense]|uniref:ABC transporter ATP-binding protein n=1 Tax=Natronorubrum aibiense TaxID=348826 RepID=UPI00187805C2|nr:ABC transporter ATP-binding protein [Natronorubrum aibiense]
MTDGRPEDDQPLLSVRNLTKHYPLTDGLLGTETGRVRAVDGIDFDVYPGETVGLVGESGCGKSTAARALLGLEEPTAGTVVFDGEDVTAFDDAACKRFRRRAQLLFQDPDSSLDPRMSVGDAIAEPLLVQGLTAATRRREIVADLLERVGLSAADAERYPHELSGGQKQRVGLARALSVNPDLLVADEPTAALDVSVQSEILALLADLQASVGLSIVLISHDLGVVRQLCDRIAVMYLGEIVERGPTEDVFTDPQHPYTRALLASIPTTDPRDRGTAVSLTGDVPSPSNPPSGCRFHTRCPEVIQPDGYDIEQRIWRRIMDLRQHLANETVDGEARASTTTLRETFSLPAQLEDDRADAVLETALEQIAAGDPDRAAALLATEFATPCERRAPSLEVTEAGQDAACLRHD